MTINIAPVTVWASSLCAAAIVCTALSMLAPKNGLGKLFKMITSAFFIICMLAPLSSLPSLISTGFEKGETNLSRSEELNETMRNQISAQAESAILAIIRNVFDSNGVDINIQKVSVNMDTGTDDRIYISSVTLYIDEESASQTAIIKQIAQQALGVGVDVKIQKN